MQVKESVGLPDETVAKNMSKAQFRDGLRSFPWWIVGIILIFSYTAISILTRPNYQESFNFIRAGLTVTIQTTFVAFGIALIFGLFTGLGRISSNVVIKNLATLYVELVRGIPMIVLIFFIALVGVPIFVNGLQQLGGELTQAGLTGLGGWLSNLKNNFIPMNSRAIVALSVTYGAFLAEIFRAGIQSIGRGQMEAARAQGMSYWDAMRFVILPQAIRNVLPALGNDFVSMLKDSSLVSVLAVRDITQITRLYSGRTFQYQEAYITLAVLYLSMTIVLSFVVKMIEKRYRQDERN